NGWGPGGRCGAAALARVARGAGGGSSRASDGCCSWSRVRFRTAVAAVLVWSPEGPGPGVVPFAVTRLAGAAAAAASRFLPRAGAAADSAGIGAAGPGSGAVTLPSRRSGFGGSGPGAAVARRGAWDDRRAGAPARAAPEAGGAAGWA